MKNIDLKPLTVITGNNFTGKTKLLKEIAKETSGSKYINFNTEVEIKVTKWLKHWFRFIFRTKFKKGITNYALRIIATGLNCKEGELLIVENPEIVLHMRSISYIAKFFTYLVTSQGVRVVIETNSSDILNSICYEVLMKNINFEDVIFLHKADKNSIEKIFVNRSGKFVDKDSNLRKYPSGFFDANTKEIYAFI